MSKCLLIMSSVLFLGSPCVARTQSYRTYVVPKPSETLQGNCEYELTLPDANRPVENIFVIFERGWQVGNLYFDPEVSSFAARLRMGLLLARHCRSKEREDMDVVPEHGIGRALVTALEQLAKESRHPELARSKLILFSFSGGGSLVARMVGYIPERIVAAVEYAPSQYDPLGMDTIDLPKEALSVPQFIIANGADKISGTVRPYGYFEKYHKMGATMTFMVQNRVPHCCVNNVQSIMLLWLNDIVRKRKSLSKDEQHDWEGFLNTEPSGLKDGWGEPVWNVADAWILQAGHTPAVGTLDAGWLPSHRFADAWLSFEKEREHPITPLE